jgi:HEAT repeat protein
MTARVQLIQVFLSSPGDVAEERKIAREVIDQMQYKPLLQGRFMLKLLAWDRPGAPPMEANLTPQEAIDRGMLKPSQCDIVVVIFWSRMGTPLEADGEKYLSGSHYEYMDALRASQKTRSAENPGKPRILLYRRTEKLTLSPDDDKIEEKLEQWRKVKEFFDNFKDEGGALRGGFNAYASPEDFRKLLEAHLEFLLKERLDDASDSLPLPAVPFDLPVPWEGSPFPGLHAFAERHAPIFFGRGREIDELIRRFGASKTGALAVVGASGSGKSSLVAAGFIPRLRSLSGDKAWRVIRFTPDEIGAGNPFASLAAVLRHELNGDNRGLARKFAENAAAFKLIAAELLRDHTNHARLLMYIDQFEELFTTIDPQYIAPFINLIETSLSSERIRVIITLRGDFYGQAIAYETLATLLRDSTYPLPPPSSAALYEMITRPAERARLRFEDDLYQRIWEDTGSDPGALALMAYVLEELYLRQADGLLTLNAYTELGGVQGAIGKRSEDVFSGLDDEARDALGRVFHELVSVKEDGTATRQRAERRIITRTRGAAALVDALIEARLLTSGFGANNQPYVEVAHEALFRSWERLAQWIEDTKDDLRLLRQVRLSAAEWHANGRREDYLWSQERLERVYQMRDNLQIEFDDLVKQFIRPENEILLERLQREFARPQPREHQMRSFADRLRDIGASAIPTMLDALMLITQREIPTVVVPKQGVPLGNPDFQDIYLVPYPLVNVANRPELKASLLESSIPALQADLIDGLINHPDAAIHDLIRRLEGADLDAARFAVRVIAALGQVQRQGFFNTPKARFDVFNQPPVLPAPFSSSPRLGGSSSLKPGSGSESPFSLGGRKPTTQDDTSPDDKTPGRSTFGGSGLPGSSGSRPSGGGLSSSASPFSTAGSRRSPSVIPLSKSFNHNGLALRQPPTPQFAALFADKGSKFTISSATPDLSTKEVLDFAGWKPESLPIPDFAASGIGNLPIERLIGALIPLALHDDDLLRKLAIYSLARLKVETAIPTLMQALTLGAEDARLLALLAILYIDSSDDGLISTALLKASADPNPDVWKTALLQVTVLPPEMALNLILEALPPRNPAILVPLKYRALLDRLYDVIAFMSDGGDLLAVTVALIAALHYSVDVERKPDKNPGLPKPASARGVFSSNLNTYDTVRLRAAHFLRLFGTVTEATRAFVDLLNDDAPHMRIMAAGALGQLAAASALSALDERLRDPDESPSLRRVIVGALSQLPDARVLDSLRYALSQDTFLPLRLDALDALNTSAALDAAAVNSVIMQALQDPHAQMRVAAIKLLAVRRVVQAVPALFTLEEDTSVEVINAVFDALTDIPNPETLGMLLKSSGELSAEALQRRREMVANLTTSDHRLFEVALDGASDPTARLFAAETLVKQPRVEALAALARLSGNGLETANPLARQALIDMLKSIEEGRLVLAENKMASPLITARALDQADLLTHPDGAVRRGAAFALLSLVEREDRCATRINRPARKFSVRIAPRIASPPRSIRVYPRILRSPQAQLPTPRRELLEYFHSYHSVPNALGLGGAPKPTRAATSPFKRRRLGSEDQSDTFEDEPIATYVSEYRVGSTPYDDSVSIETPDGKYLGEMGIGLYNGDDRIIECWVFDNKVAPLSKCYFVAERSPLSQLPNDIDQSKIMFLSRGATVSLGSYGLQVSFIFTQVQDDVQPPAIGSFRAVLRAFQKRND